MKTLNLATLALVIIGAINWGLIGLLNFDLVAAVFGTNSTFSHTIYTLVGLAGVYQLVPFFQALSSDTIDTPSNTPARPTV
jgi:uncharacterized protein